MDQLAGLGYAITVLLGVIGYLIAESRNNARHDSEKMLLKFDENTKSLGQLSTDLKMLTESFKEIRIKAETMSNDLLTMKTEHSFEIEMIRSRTHKLFNFLTAVKLRMELDARARGEPAPFRESDWEMPTMSDMGSKI